MEPFLGCQCYDSAVTGAWQVTGGSDWGMELSIVQCVRGSKQTEQTQQAEKIKIKKQIPPPNNQKHPLKGEGRVKAWRSVSQHRWSEVWRVPPLSLLLLVLSLLPPALCPLPPHAVPLWLLQSLSLPLVIYLLGEVSVRWRSWTIPAHFPLERGSSPFVFQSGLGQALPAASWPASRILARSLTAALSLLCFSLFFFFFFSPPSSLPSIMEKQFRFSRFTERGKGRGNIHASSNKCFSSSPRRGNSLLGWWGFQPTSPSLCPWRQHLHAASIPPTAPGPKSHLPAASGGPMGTRRLMRCCPMEKPCPVLQANTELTNTEPVSPKLKSAVYLGMNYNYS